MIKITNKVEIKVIKYKHHELDEEAIEYLNEVISGIHN